MGSIKIAVKNPFGYDSGFITVGFTALAYIQPQWSEAVNIISWAIPLAVFVATLILVPRFIYRQEVQKRRNLEKQLDVKPSIEVKSVKEHDLYCLEVKNRGIKGEFEAQIQMLEGNQYIFHTFDQYLSCWKYADERRAQILRDQSDKIMIASLFTDSPPYYSMYLNLHYYDLVNNKKDYKSPSSYNVGTKLVSKNGTEKPLTKPEFVLLVNISSRPSLRESSFVRKYKLGLDGLEELSD